MTVLDDWPALAPIRTSSACCRALRVSCETVSSNESSSSSADNLCRTSFHQPTKKSFVSHKGDPAPPLKSADVPSSCAASSTSDRNFFSSFQPARASSHILIKPATSPRRSASDCVGLFRSFANFSVPIHRSGIIARSTGISHPCATKLGAPPTLGHVKVLRSHCPSNKSPAATIIPPNMLGRKTGVGYESDLPTSPEVTCMGRVRRKKHRKAIGKPSNLGVKKGKNIDLDGLDKVDAIASLGRGKQEVKASRWRQILGVKGASQSCHDMSRRSDFDNLRIDMGRFSSSFELSWGVAKFEDAPRSALIAEELPLEERNRVLADKGNRCTLSEECTYDLTDKGDHCSLTVPPSNCLLLMRNGGRSKGRHAYDEIFGAAPRSLCSVKESVGGKGQSDPGIWRRGVSELLSWDLKERLKLEQQKPCTSRA